MRTEKTEVGEQFLGFGLKPIEASDRLAVLATRPMRSRAEKRMALKAIKNNKPIPDKIRHSVQEMNGPLFSDSRLQTDLF